MVLVIKEINDYVYVFIAQQDATTTKERVTSDVFEGKLTWTLIIFGKQMLYSANL